MLVRTMSRKPQWIQGASSAALREAFLEQNFRPRVAATFDRDPDVQSVLLVVGQFYSDEAEDAVHVDLVPALDAQPEWPECVRSSPFYGDDEGSIELTKRGEAALAWDEIFTSPFKFPELDGNTTAITAFASFCPEVTSQEDSLDVAYTPYAIGRRGEGGAVMIEVIGSIVRPEWEDRFDVGFSAPEGVTPKRLYDNEWSAPAPPAAKGRGASESSGKVSFLRRLFGSKRP